MVQNTTTPTNAADAPSLGVIARQQSEDLLQTVEQFNQKRAMLLARRTTVHASVMQILRAPVGCADVKQLIFSTVDFHAKQFTADAGWAEMLGCYFHPKGPRPDIGSYQPGLNFERSFVDHRRPPLLVGDVIFMSNRISLHHAATYLAGVGGADFVQGYRSEQSNRRPLEPAAALSALLCFLFADLIKERIGAFVDHWIATNDQAATARSADAIDMAAVKKELVALDGELRAIDDELGSLDHALAELPVSFPERAEARLRLNLPLDLHIPAQVSLAG